MQSILSAILFAVFAFAPLAVAAQDQVGADVVELSSGLRAFFGVPEGFGVLVSEVAPGSAASTAGLVAGDVVVAVAGQPIADPNSFRLALQSVAGGNVGCDIYRYGEPYTVTLVVPDGQRGAFDGSGGDAVMEQLMRVVGAADFGVIMEQLQVQIDPNMTAQMQQLLSSPEVTQILQQLDPEDMAQVQAQIQSVQSQLESMLQDPEQLDQIVDQLRGLFVQ